MNAKTKKIVLTALLASLVCVTTMSIRIPVPSTGGYIHPGDALVILSGVILGPIYGFLAAGIGSAMADLLGGYFIYVPATLLIKGMAALCCGFIYRKFIGSSFLKTLGLVLCGITSMFVVVAGYFLYEAVLYGYSGAIAAVPANFIQGISGIIISALLYPILFSIPEIRRSTY